MASELVKQVSARRNFNKDAVDMGTQIVLDNMRHPKQESIKNNFAVSTLGLAITGQNQRNQQWTNQKMKNVKKISQKATENVKQHRRNQAQYNARLMAKHGAGYDIAGALAKQRELVNKGYKLAIDGDWGKQSEAAWQDYQVKKKKAEQDAIDNNILYNLGKNKNLKSDPREISKGVGGMVSHALNNMFPFGYDNSKDTQMANNFLHKYGINYDVGGLYGATTKLFGGMTGTSKAGKAMQEFADLDLNNPKNQSKADSLWNIARQEEPRWGHLGGDMKRKQFVVRGRLDQNLLHGGQPQKYNTYSTDYGYLTNGGDSTYTFTDSKARAIEQAWARNYVKNNIHRVHHKNDDRNSKSFVKEDGSNGSNDVVYSNDGKHIIFSVPGGDPYAQHGNFSIVTDLDGKNGRTYDVWDFGLGPFSSNNLFGTRKISTGIKF